MAVANNPYIPIAIAAARAYGIDPGIFTRQINQESGFSPTAHSGAGAEGIAQFMPATAQGYGVNPWDPKSALYGAAKMDASNLKQYGSYARMLSAYNSGNPDAYKNPNFAKGETANYVRNILQGKNPYIAAGASQIGSTASDSSRQGLLQYLIQSNQAIANKQAAPSMMPMLLGLQTGAFQNTPTDSFASPSGMKLASVPDAYATRSGIQLNAPVLSKAEQLAKQFGVKINSGYRDPQHNSDVGGAKNSDHLSGNAVDFTGSLAQMKALYAYAQRAGFPYVEPWNQAGGNHVHISFARG